MAQSKGTLTARAIRAQALKLFADRGYAAISMREIAEGVGIGPGAIYNHFATKQDILREVMVGHLTDLIAAFDAEPPPRGAPERFSAFVRFHLRYHFDRPDEVFVSYMELRSLEQENFAEIEELRRRYEGFLREILVDGAQEASLAVAEPAVQTRAIIAMLNGVTNWYRRGGPLTPDTVQAIYVDMARRSVGLSPATNADREETSCSMAG